MRGLKLQAFLRSIFLIKSHLLQMRGSKLIYNNRSNTPYHVASFTDAWIETIAMQSLRKLRQVASFTDAWIETCQSAGVFSQCHVASFTDAWIETRQTEQHVQAYMVASFTDAWIET